MRSFRGQRGRENEKVLYLKEAYSYLRKAYEALEKAQSALSAGFYYWAEKGPEQNLALAWAHTVGSMCGLTSTLTGDIDKYIFYLQYEKGS